jgi:hypothetical protein
MAGAGNRGTSFGQQQGYGQGHGQGHESSSGTLGNIQEKAQEFASSVAGRAGEAWDSTRHGAQQVASRVADTAGESWDSVAQFFGRYPVPMFLAGIGLGFLLAKAFDNLSGDMTSRMSSSSNRGDFGGNRY